MLTSILAFIITAALLLNVLQLPVMALGEGIWSFINRTKYEGLGKALFEAKHSLWWLTEVQDDLFDKWFMWDLLCSLAIWIILMLALSTGILWYILGFLALLFGFRFIIDKTKDDKND